MDKPFVGIAAANTGGITINQFSGINPQYVGGAVLDEKALLQSVCCATSVIRRWRDTKVLIIDEISMMSPVMFQVKLEYHCTLTSQKSLIFIFASYLLAIAGS